jgi:hypothetical protein
MSLDGSPRHPKELPLMFESISRGWGLALSAWKVLYTDKKLIVFPIISGIACVLVLASFVTPIAVLASNGAFDSLKDVKDYSDLPGWFWPTFIGTLFLFYFVNYFVIVYFNAAFVSCALQRFNGQEPTILGGLSAAGARLPQIIAWALVSATVGVLLKLIELFYERAGEIISAILGSAWTIMTYFVVPVLVVEKVGPFAAVWRSISLLRQTWGEGLVGTFSLVLFHFLLMLPAILLLIVGGALCSVSLPVGLAVVGLGALAGMLAFAASSALDTIFLSALYQYAAFKQVPAGFDSTTIERAFTGKRR